MADLACPACVATDPTRTLPPTATRDFSDPHLMTIFRMIPKDERSLGSHLADELGAMDVPRSYTDRLALALFVGVVRHGSRRQRALAQSIRRSMKSLPDGSVAFGQTQLKLYQIFMDDMSDADMELVARVLFDAEPLLNGAEPHRKIQIFDRYLEGLAAGRPDKERALRNLRRNRCFGLE